MPTPEEIKLTHWVPSLFVLGCVVWLVTPLISLWLFVLGGFSIAAYFLAIFIDGLRQSKSLGVAILAVPSAILQLTGYGLGFLKERF